ncbi:MAG: hypothetical protein ACOYMZ_01245 [Minisyncoccia bacterium]
MRKHFLLFSIILSFALPPVLAQAQANCSIISPENYQQCCIDIQPIDTTQCDASIGLDNPDNNPILVVPTKPTATQALYRYNPSISIGIGDSSFNGVRFTGVGAAVLSCALGSNAIRGIINNTINNTISSVADAKIPVVSSIASFFRGAKATIEGEQAGQPVSDATARARLKTLETKEQCWDKLARAAAQQAVQQMTVKTMNWVNTGFDGNPLYVRDIDSYLKSIRNQQLVTYFQQAQGSDPIFGNALRSIITQQVTGRGGVNERVCVEYSNQGPVGSGNGAGLTGQSTCIRYGTTAGFGGSSMNTPQARAYNDFLGDFTQGGWSAMLNTSNNPLSALFSATDRLSTTIRTQQENIKSELQRNSGYLDIKRCVEWLNQAQVTSGNGTGLSKEPVCGRYETTTPGSTIAQQVSTVTSSPIRQAELADELNEAVGAFFDSLLNRLFSRDSGLAGLKGGAMNGLGGTNLGSNVVLDYNGDPFSTTGTNAFDLPGFLTGVDTNFDISRPQQLRAILQAQHTFLNRSKDVAVVAARGLPVLGRLDYCVPGPNPAWRNGFGENLTLFTGAFKFVGISKYDVVARSYVATDPISEEQKTIYGTGVFSRQIDTRAARDENENYSGIGFDFLGEPTDNDIVQYFRNASTLLTQQLNTNYNQKTVSDAFANLGSTAGEVAYNRGQAVTAYRLTETLVPYAANVASLISTYDQSNVQVEGNIAELTAIHDEVLSIVKTAKARYIAERAAAGTPVDRQCLDAAYVIDESTVTGPARQESDTTSQLLIDMEAANTYFNSQL